MADDDMVKLSAPEARATPRPDDMVKLGGPAPDYSGGAPTPAPTPIPEGLGIRAAGALIPAAGQVLGEAAGVPIGTALGAAAGGATVPLTGPVGPVAGGVAGAATGAAVGAGLGNVAGAHIVNGLRRWLGYPPIPVDNFHEFAMGGVLSGINKVMSWAQGGAAKYLTEPRTYGTASPAEIEQVGEQGAGQEFKRQVEQSAGQGFSAGLGKTPGDYEARMQNIANDPAQTASGNMLENSRKSVLDMSNRALKTVATDRANVIQQVAGNTVNNLDTLSDRVDSLKTMLHQRGAPTGGPADGAINYAEQLIQGTAGPVTIRKLEQQGRQIDEILRRSDPKGVDTHVLSQLSDAYHETVADELGPTMAGQYRDLSKKYRELARNFEPMWGKVLESKVAEDVPNRMLALDRPTVNMMLSRATPEEINHLQDSLAGDILREKDGKEAAALFTKLEQKHPEAMRKLLPGFDNAKAWADIMDAGKGFQKAFKDGNPTLEQAFQSGMDLAQQTPQANQFMGEMQRLKALPEMEQARRTARLEASAHPPALNNEKTVLGGLIKVDPSAGLPFGRFGLSTYGRRYVAFQGVLGAMALGAGGSGFGLFNKNPYVAAMAVPLLFGPMGAGIIARKIISDPEHGAEMFQMYKALVNAAQGAIDSRKARYLGYYGQRLALALAADTMKEDGITAPPTPAAAPNPAPSATPAAPGTP